MIEVRELTKRYGDVVAVDGLTFTVRPGHVTGFCGPNGAGKSTTMRAILGLDLPTSGQALVNGKPFRASTAPLREVGALLDAGAVHGGRTAFAHLHCLARSNGIGRERVAEVLDLVGLGQVARKRVGGFSLGMKQRLGVAAALLGDPAVLLFDEPVNGLDPEGIQWIRGFLRGLAREGRTVLVSSHLMSEMALTADRVLVVGRGRLLADASMSELAERYRRDVFVRSDDDVTLAEVLTRQGASVVAEAEGGLAVSDLDERRIAKVAASEGVAVFELTPRSASFEDAYFDLTRDSVQYRGVAEGSAR
ncbi:ATP-binding cassette domain-containing protein [Saccharomonospora xinjiangensis]|uniref:ABC transporter ATP-binding protein n=1 Tax=Saccharomonospora xinjiangensis TaxID=75294 RepID=UPI00106F2F90|nr:ATP-binding cassette domain-containing protein [Saccharomonospora xinjiangensis]QBQ62039.1 putative ABC transporter ATP-binding protein YbhF [Saccharomonospora xinjiangensis]